MKLACLHFQFEIHKIEFDLSLNKTKIYNVYYDYNLIITPSILLKTSPILPAKTIN